MENSRRNSFHSRLLGIFLGALLIAGLFFFFRSRFEAEPASSMAGLKPSQLDFSQSNQIQTAEAGPASRDLTVKKIELKPSQSLSNEDQKKWTIFEDILNSKNDNDPRMDQDLKHLSLEMHENLRDAYASLPAENRNGRGLIAFLIARDLRDVRDLQFIQDIFQESPCLSFQNCSQTNEPDPHMDGINETSLNYPQLASLYQLQKQLESNPSILNSDEMKAAAIEALREARQFPSSAVQNRAREVQEKFGL